MQCTINLNGVDKNFDRNELRSKKNKKICNDSKNEIIVFFICCLNQGFNYPNSEVRGWRLNQGFNYPNLEVRGRRFNRMVESSLIIKYIYIYDNN